MIFFRYIIVNNCDNPSEVSYTSATTGRGDHEVHKGHVVALEKK
jgi:hypothetical protein